MTNDQIIERIMACEGGFVDDPDDRGGATNYGITQKTLSDWLGFPVTRANVKDLAESSAREIYLRVYIYKPRFDEIEDAYVRHLVVDSGVQHGPVRVVQWIQRLVGTTVDGVLGPITLEAMNNASADTHLYRELLRTRIMYYAEIVRGRPSQAKFLVGWMSRVTSFLR